MMRDDRGAMVVSGLFMATFMIGVIWYLIGIGDAIFWKERMQDGADAVAFAPAVVHARGMNILALVNVSMASILSVLVSVKVVQSLLLAANAAACALNHKHYVNPDCPYLGSKEAPYARFVQRYDSAVARTNGALHATSADVAELLPLLASRRGADAIRAYSPQIQGGFTASISLTPGALERRFSGELADGAGRGEALRLGLPVEDDDYANLCHHSGSVRSIVFSPIDRRFDDAGRMIGTSLGYKSGYLGDMLGGSPDAFCGGESSEPALPPTTSPDAAKELTQDICGGFGIDVTKCTKDIATAVAALTAPSQLGKQRSTSKRLYRPARMGNDYFATWGFVSSSRLVNDGSPDKGLDVALHGNAGAADPMDAFDQRMRETQVAKSEFYYDPRRGGPRDVAAVRDEALWNPRWRARLRHVRQPNGDLAAFFSGPSMPYLGFAAVDADVAGIVTDVLAAPPERLAAWADENVGPVVHARRTGGIIH